MQSKIKITNIITALITFLMLLLCFYFVSLNSQKVAFASISNQTNGEQSPWDIVPISKLEITSDGASELQPGQSVNLDITTTPDYAIQTASNIEYQFVNGAYLANIANNILTVNNDATIGGTIIVRAVVDNVISSNTLTFTVVKIPVESVAILNTETQISQNQTLKITTLLLPTTATYKNIMYEIAQGAQYAVISSDGLIKVNNNLPSGDLSIKVKITSANDNSIYDEREFTLYVPTINLGLSTTNLSPTPNTIINLVPSFSSTATQIIPTYNIIEGEEFIDYIEGNTLKIKDNITAFNPQIILNCSRDGYTSNNITLNIYIPTTTLQVTSSKSTINQNEMLQLGVLTTPANATLNNLKYYIVDNTNASLTINGLLTAKINTAIQTSSVFVYAVIDDIESEQIEITIEKPNIILLADSLNLSTSSTSAQSTSLTTLKDDEVQSPNNVIYNIKEGSEYVESIIDGVLQIKTNINAFNPKIILNASCGEFESGVIIIEIKVLAEDIEIANTTTKVEQSMNYNFEGQILPLNATLVNEPLAYSINVDENIATISNTGILTISSSASIGSQITITITGPDNTSVTQIVTVITVYATKMRVNGIDNQTVSPDYIIHFDVEFPEPFNVSNSVKTYSISLYDGERYVAKISNDKKTLIIKSLSELVSIGLYKPTFTVKISSNQNGKTLTAFRTFTVHTPVTKVDITRNTNCKDTFVQNYKTYLYENTDYLISDLVDTQITPLNSDIRNATYTLSVNGVFCTYASITNNVLHIKNRNELPSGNCEFTLKAQAENFSDTQTFSIFIKNTELTLSVKNVSNHLYPYAPMSTKTYGEKIEITTIVDAKATNPYAITFAFEKDENGNELGADLINYLVYENGILSFYIKNSGDILTSNRCIELIATHQDGLTASLPQEMIVHIPVQDITLTNTCGEMTISRIEANKLKLNIQSSIYTATTNEGTLDYLSNRSEPILNIPSTLKAGNIVTVTIETNDPRLNFIKRFQFIVDKLYVPNFKYIVNGNISTYPYDKDSAGVVIDKTNPQLYTGRYTNVLVTYNGTNLSELGVSLSYGISKNNLIISALSTTKGDSTLSPTITIYDGNFTYNINLPTINIFRPMSGTPSLTNGIITKKVTQLTLGDNSSWDENATYGLSDLVFYGSNLNGVSLTSSGLLTITSNTASKTQTIILRCTQKYNGIDVLYVNSNGTDYTVTQTIKSITLSASGGTGGSTSFLAVDGCSTSITVPTKVGYIFGGYYTSTLGSGTQYFNSLGQLLVTHSAYVNTSKIYAKWTAITYTIIGRTFVNNQFQKNAGTITLSYNVSTNVTVDGDGFKYFLVNGSKYYNNPSTFSNLTTIDGDTVYIDAYFEQSCIATGTMITLADGTQKAVEDLDGSEMLLVWNLESGQFDTAPILFIDSHGEDEYDIIHLYFSDETDVKVIYEHGFWDFDLNKYVYINNANANDYIGHWFNKQYIDENGNLAYTRVQLTLVTYEQEYTNSWSPVTFGHLCYYVNGMLSVPAKTEGFINIFDVNPETMQYDQEQMNADIEKYGLFDYETDFSNLIPIEIFNAFNGQYLKIALAKGLITQEQLLALINQYAKFLL